jgi:hypothetical protein
VTDTANDELPEFSETDLKTDDFFLELMLRTFLGHQLEGNFSLTLLYGGSIVSGDAISHARWLTGWIDQLEQAGVEGLDELRPMFEERRQKAIDLDERMRAADREVLPPRFVHLIDATIYNGGVTHDVKYWRGPISRISGWSLGKYATD